MARFHAVRATPCLNAWDKKMILGFDLMYGAGEITQPNCAHIPGVGTLVRIANRKQVLNHGGG